MVNAIRGYFLKKVKSNYDGNRKCGFEHADLLISSFMGRRANRIQSLVHYAESKRAWVAYCNQKIATCEKKIARLQEETANILKVEQTENRLPDPLKLDSVLGSIQFYAGKIKRLSRLRDSCIKSAIRARIRLAKTHERAAARIKYSDMCSEEWKNAFMEWGNVSPLQASAHMGNSLAIANGTLCSARSLIESGAVSTGAAELLNASKRYFSAGHPSEGIALGREAAELLKNGGWEKVATAYLEVAQLAESSGMFGEAIALYALGERHAPVHSDKLIESLKTGRKNCEEKINRLLDGTVHSFLQQNATENPPYGNFF